MRRWLAAALLSCASLCVFGAPSPADLVQKVEGAEFVTTAEGVTPAGDAAWRPVALAHVWSPPPGVAFAEAWFRVRLSVPALRDQPYALYVPAINHSGRIFVGGRIVGEVGPFDGTMPLQWNRAQFFVLPPALLHAGENELRVQERVYGWEHGWLSAMQFGPEAALRPVYEWRHFWQTTFVMILGATVFVLSVFVLGVWVFRRDQTMYLWFGLATGVWAFISTDYFVEWTPFDGYRWEQAIEIAQVLHAVLLCLFVLRYTARRIPWLERGMAVWWVAGSAMMLSVDHRVRWVEYWYLGTLVGSLYFWALLIGAAWKRRQSEAVLLATAAMVTIVLTAYDLWLYSRHTWTDRLYLAHFGAPLFLFTLGWVLMRRFVESLNAYEALAAVLEQRVAAKASELHSQYDELIEARRSEALAVERARLMSEMHDGIGSQLTLALSLVSRDAEPGGESARIAAVLRESIEDLQLIIDSLEPVEHDLLTVLGTLRYRVQDRLQRSGIEIEWNVHDLPSMPLLTPQNVLSVLRIVQEAFANGLKHSGATRIEVAADLVDAGTPHEAACIRIVDDGRGISGTRTGRGLESMRRRAAGMGATVEISSRPGRTEVALRIPTRATPAAAR